MNKEQKQGVHSLFPNVKGAENLDYVSCWFKKSADMMKENPAIKTAFIATKSISQGEQVPILWKPLTEQGFIINFAHKPFKWDADNKGAIVHCVIIGYSLTNNSDKKLYDSTSCEEVQNISPYLIDAETVYLESRNTPISQVPAVKFGNQPRDGGNFILTKEEKEAVLSKEPELKDVIKPYLGSMEILYNKERYCFWLQDVPSSVIQNSKVLQERISKVREFRLASVAKTTNQYAKVPHLFAQIAQPNEGNYLFIPIESGSNRRYIPICFFNNSIIASNSCFIIPHASLYHFAVLSSAIHMEWVQKFAGRLSVAIRYSSDIVYNNFPWPENVTDEEKAEIEILAQKVLDIREDLKNIPLAELYHPEKMPINLREAHTNLERKIFKLYGLPERATEKEIYTELLRRHKKLTNPLEKFY